MQSEIQVPAGLTTVGLAGRRFLARFIDSVAIVLLLAILVVGLASGASRGHAP